MTFDSKVSEDISLSRILDCFIEDGENPDVIMYFLKEHESSIQDIIDYSDCSYRLFQLDFIAKCNLTQAAFFMKLSRMFGIRAVYLSWQVLQSNLDESMKMMFRSNLTISNTIRHPYNGFMGKIISEFDVIFKNKDDDICTIVDRMNMMSDDKFKKYCECIFRSLFVERLLQRDVFVMLSIQKQWILINCILSTIDNTITHLLPGMLYKFIKQILNSTVDTRIKYEVYNKLTQLQYVEINNSSIPDKLKEVIDNADSYAKFELILMLNNIDDFGENVIFYMLKMNKLKLLFGLAEHHRDFLESNFDILDLLDYIKSGKENETA